MLLTTSFFLQTYTFNAARPMGAALPRTSFPLPQPPLQINSVITMNLLEAGSYDAAHVSLNENAVSLTDYDGGATSASVGAGTDTYVLHFGAFVFPFEASVFNLTRICFFLRFSFII